jgi:hypothetical protein
MCVGFSASIETCKCVKSQARGKNHATIRGTISQAISENVGMFYLIIGNKPIKNQGRSLTVPAYCQIQTN